MKASALPFQRGVYVGHAPQWDRVVFRGDPAGRTFIAFWLLDGRVAARMSANIWQVSHHLTALIASRRRVAVDRLVDPTVPLDDLSALLAPDASGKEPTYQTVAVAAEPQAGGERP